MVNPDEGTKLPPPTVPEHLARWLLTHEAGGQASPLDSVAAAERVYTRLRTGMIVFLGPTGVDSMWRRALFLAQQTTQWPVGGDAVVAGSLPFGLPLDGNGQAATEAPALHLAAFTSFFTLLFTFVGAELGLRLIRQVWPELPLAEAGSQIGAATS